MPFQKSDFALSLYVHPDEQTWRNIHLSGCKTVLLGYSLAKDITLLAHLASSQISVVVRIEQDTPDTDAQITMNLRSMKQAANIVAVIMGCEWDAVVGVNWGYGAPDWSQNAMYAHRSRVEALTAIVRGLGLKAVSPALSDPPEAISEDGQLRPGRYTFAEIVRPAYDDCDGTSGHIYNLGWSGVVDTLRFKFGLRQVCETWHRPIYLDEVGVLLDDDLAKARAYTDMADIILAHPARSRVEMMSFFCSAGAPNGAWDARYLVRSEEAYRHIGQWMGQ